MTLGKSLSFGFFNYTMGRVSQVISSTDCSMGLNWSVGISRIRKFNIILILNSPGGHEHTYAHIYRHTIHVAFLLWTTGRFVFSFCSTLSKVNSGDRKRQQSLLCQKSHHELGMEHAQGEDIIINV